MATVFDLVDLGRLTNFVRDLPFTPPGTPSLEQFLPNRYVPDIKGELETVTRRNRTAMYRSWDTPTRIGKRDTFSRRTVELPPLGEKIPVTEEQRIRLEVARLGGDGTSQLIDMIYDDVANTTNDVNNRVELARGDVLTDGKFTLAGENGLNLEADFGVTALGTNIVSASTPWTTLSTSIFDDLTDWIEVYYGLNGVNPGYLIVPKAIHSLMLRNEELIQFAFRNGNNAPGVMTPGVLQQTLDAYDFPQLVIYDRKLDVNDVETRVLPADKVIMVPQDPRSLGETLWGITAEALELVGSNAVDMTIQQAPGLVATISREDDPVRTWTKVAAVSMPVIYDPKRLFVADVSA